MLNIISDGVMDSRIGLDYIVENREYVKKLAAALDTSNATVKKQVFELLSALCSYNAEGYARALETLDYYKVSAARTHHDSSARPFALFFRIKLK